MTTARAVRRPGKLSILMIVTSIGASIGISVGLDVVGLSLPAYAPEQIIVTAALFNATLLLWGPLQPPSTKRLLNLEPSDALRIACQRDYSGRRVRRS